MRNLALVAGVLGAALAQSNDWDSVDVSNSQSTPSARCASALAPGDAGVWSPTSVFLFGGDVGLRSAAVLPPATQAFWRLDIAGRRWERRNYSRCSIRMFHRMDNVANNLYIYGGFDTMRTLSDVCVYSIGNNTWHANVTTSIPSMLHASAVWRDTIVYFGGQNASNTMTNAVRLFNTTSRAMTDLGSTSSGTPGAPWPRIGASAVVTHDNQLLVFGGKNASKYDNKVYKYNLVTRQWVPFTPSGTAADPRAGHSAVLSWRTGRMIVYGGEDGGSSYLRDVVYYDTYTDEWVGTGDRGERLTQHAAMAYGGDGMLVFGGEYSEWNDEDRRRGAPRQEQQQKEEVERHALAKRETIYGLLDEMSQFEPPVVTTGTTGTTGTTRGTTAVGTTRGTTAVGTTRATTARGTTAFGTTGVGTTRGTTAVGTSAVGTTAAGSTRGTTSIGTTAAGTTARGTTGVDATVPVTTVRGTTVVGTSSPAFAGTTTSNFGLGSTTSALAPADASCCSSDVFAIDTDHGPAFEVSAADRQCTCYGVSRHDGGLTVGPGGTHVKSVRHVSVHIGLPPVPPPPPERDPQPRIRRTTPQNVGVVGIVTKEFSYGAGMVYENASKLHLSMTPLTPANTSAVFVVSASEISTTGARLHVLRVDDYGGSWDDDQLSVAVTVTELM